MGGGTRGGAPGKGIGRSGSLFGRVAGGYCCSLELIPLTL